jgi:hypothetical protein
MGKPYEYFCKEHISWLEKSLKSIKLGTGLNFQTKDITKDKKDPEEFSSAHYKSLRVFYQRGGKLKFRIAYTA